MKIFDCRPFPRLNAILICLLALSSPVLLAKEKQELSPTNTALANSSEYQSLALATFDFIWNQLNDYHFDRTFNSHDWNRVKADYRPRAAKAKSNQELRPILQEMLNLLGQSHMSIIPGDVAALMNSNDDDAADGNAEPGFQVRLWKEKFLITSVQPGSSADSAGIKPGFTLESVEDQRVETFIKNLPNGAAPSHREMLAWKYVMSRLRGLAGSEIQVGCITPSGTKSFKVAREPLPGQTVKFGNFPEITAHLESNLLRTANQRSVGYIEFNFWMLPTALKFNQVIDEFRDAHGIIIDLRGNLGGLAGMVMGVAGHFMNKPVSFGTMKMRDNELHFNINPRLVNNNGERVQPFSGPVAILLDGMSLSASELFAFGMQETSRAKIFGLPTSGQALPSVTDKLPNEDIFYHPFADFISGKGTRIEGRGVLPDVEVPYAPADLLAGKDPVLEAALKWMSETEARLSGSAR